MGLAAARIRWDRLGRVALLLVLVGVIALYVNPLRSYLSTWQEAKSRRAEVAELQRENDRLRARKAELRNPRVMNTTATFELKFAQNYTASATYVYAKSDFLRTGGFSSTAWNRNFTKLGEDRFGRAILGPPLDPTIAAAYANLSVHQNRVKPA